MTSRTALVTGGAGFIGCAIAPGLLREFDRVVAVDSLHPQIHPTRNRPADLPEAVELIEGDISRAETWERVLAEVEPEVVVHLAAETGTGQSLTESTRHAEANVVGTTRMLDAFASREQRPRRIVLTSSRAVYGEGAWKRSDGEVFYPAQRTAATLGQGQWDFEDAEPLAMDARTVDPHPVSVYAATKLTQEHLLRVWANSFGVEPAIVRLQHVYGPGQAMANPYTGIMTLFCRFAREGRSIALYEDGEVRRDFVLIDDVAAVVAAAVSEKVSPTALDIGSGEFQTIGTATRLIAKSYGAPEPHITGQFREGDVRHAWADVTAAQEFLPWAPQYSLVQDIERLTAQIEAQPDVPPLNI